MKTGMLVTLCILLGTRYTFGHGGKDHNKKKDTATTVLMLLLQKKKKYYG